MPKILCILPNASTEISGVKFNPHGEAMLSEDVSQEVAESFASIDGYKVVQDELPVDTKPTEPLKPASAEAVKPAHAKPASRSRKAAPEQAAAASPALEAAADASGAADDQNGDAGASDADNAASDRAGANGSAAAVDGDPIF